MVSFDRNFQLWFASGGSQLRRTQIRINETNGEEVGVILAALYPEISEARFLHWLHSQLRKTEPLEHFLLQRDFENAVRHCRDPNLAAVISALSCCSSNNCNESLDLLQKQLRKWQQDGTTYNPAWEILAANEQKHSGLEAFAIRLHYKYAHIPDFRLRLASAVRTANAHEFWECLIKHALGEFSGSLPELLALLKPPKSRLLVASKLGADENVLRLLNSQIQEVSSEGTLSSLLKSQRFAEAAEYLSASYLTFPTSELYSQLDQLGETITCFPKLHLLQLYRHKPPGHETLMETIMNSDIAYLPAEREMRKELAEYLARSHRILVQNDLSPNARLMHLHVLN